MVEEEDIIEEVFERWRCEVDKGQSPVRVDKYLSEHMAGTSRNRIQNAADAGNVWVNGHPVASNHKVKPLDIIQVLLDHEPHDYTILPENIPLTIVYEDEDVMAFMDIDPINEGHVLLVPKEHYLDVDEIPDELLSHLMRNSQYGQGSTSWERCPLEPLWL